MRTRSSLLVGHFVIALAIASSCVLTGIPARPAPAQAATFPQARGVDAGNGWDNLPIVESRRDLREAAKLGSDTVRVVLRWTRLAPSSPRVYDSTLVAHVGDLLKAADAQGLEVVATLVNTPCWASSAPRSLGTCHLFHAAYPPRDSRDFGRFVFDIVRRWGGRLAAVEVWNEPNTEIFWRGTVAAYVGLVREAKRAVDRSRHPDVAVVGGALSGADTQYLEELYEHGVGRWADAISVHPYDLRGPGAFGDPTVPRHGDPWSFASGVPAIRRTMVANGDRGPLWITEFGIADCPSLPACTSRRQQARYLASAVRLAATWRYVDTFLIYRLRDWYGPGTIDLSPNYGVLHRDWTFKPAAAAISRAFASLPSKGHRRGKARSSRR